MTIVEIICPQCNGTAQKYIGHVTRANKIGAPVYCSKACSGLASRNNKTLEQKKAEKAAYDKEYLKKDVEIKKHKRHEYFKRTYNPQEAAIARKKRMPQHVEYCRQPKYREYKKKYDQQYRANKEYGEFGEAFIALIELAKEVDNRLAKSEAGIYNKSQNRKRKWQRQN